MNEKETILIVDDDSEIREILQVLLQSEGYRLLEASSGEEALSVFNESVSLVILDVMLGGLTGYQVCMKLRQISNVPVLFLTAKDKDSDLTMGFSSGGDDYLSKPFSYTELLARVKGLLRRYNTYSHEKKPAEDRPLVCGALSLHPGRNEVTVSGKAVSLTDKEYQILRLMLTYRGKVFTAQNLYESVWEEPFLYASGNTVMVHIRRLREKIEADPRQPAIVKTVWGKGYRVE